MECNMCQEFVHEKDIVYDYLGNEYCKSCMQMELEWNKVMSIEEDENGTT